MASEPASPHIALPDAAEGARPQVGRRAAPRLRLAIPAKFVSLYSRQSCVLIDISCTGARMGLAEPIATGQSGYIAIGALELFGMIVRAERGEQMAVNAIAFDDPITQGEVLEVRSFAEGFALREHRALREQVRRWVSGES